MPARPRIVVLCGSTRFREAYARAFRDEEHAGRICLSVPCYKDDPCCKTPDDHARLDELHLAKIDLADEVLVVNARWWRCRSCKQFAPASHPPRLECSCEPPIGRGEWAPYVGESTRREIAYAVAHGKPVRYLETPQ